MLLSLRLSQVPQQTLRQALPQLLPLRRLLQRCHPTCWPVPAACLAAAPLLPPAMTAEWP